MKKVFTVLLMTALMVFAVLPVFAQGGNESAAAEKAVFPTGDSLTIIVPVSAGAGMDTQARIIARYLEKQIGKPVVIENIAGGATVLASQTYLAEDVDSDYIIMLSTDHMVITPVLQKANYSYKNFVPLSANSYSEEYFWVNVDSPFQTWDDVIAASKVKPVIFGTGAKSGPVYIATKAACTLSGVNMENVVANSIPESIANMMGGHVDITWSSYATAKSYYLAGKIRPILGTGVETFHGENGELNVPTLKSLGYDFSFSSCNTFAMRSDADPAAIEYMRTALRNAYLDPDFKAEWVAAGQPYLEDSSYTFAEKAVEQKIDLLPTVKEIFGL